MGDRGNIVIDGVWFYTHWGGSEIKQDLQKALNKNSRWEDSAYLARIIFCQMIEGDTEGETGFGISLTMQDNEHPILFVDTESQEVIEKTEELKIVKKWTFEEFTKEDFTK